MQHGFSSGIRIPFRSIYIAALAFVLMGCEVLVPISQFDAGVENLCESGRKAFVHNDIERVFSVVLLESPDQLISQCGPAAAACTDGFTVWVPADASCPSHMAHELNHVFGMHFVDAESAGSHPKEGLYARVR